MSENSEFIYSGAVTERERERERESSEEWRAERLRLRRRRRREQGEVVGLQQRAEALEVVEAHPLEPVVVARLLLGQQGVVERRRRQRVVHLRERVAVDDLRLRRPRLPPRLRRRHGLLLLLPALHLLPLVLLVVQPAQHPVIQPERARARGGGGAALLGGAVLVHEPLRLDAAGGRAVVEHERLLDPGRPAVVQHGLVGAGGLPVAGGGGAVGAGAVGVLAVARGEEVPLAAAEEGEGGEVPGVVAVEVELGDDGDRGGAARGARAEVVRHQLLVGGVEAEARREVQVRLRVAHSPLRRRRRRHGHEVIDDGT